MSATVCASAKDQLIEKKFSKKDPSLKDIMDVLRDMKTDGSNQGKRLDRFNLLFTELLKKYKALDETVSGQKVIISNLQSELSDQRVKMIHLANDTVEAKNVNRLNSVIFTGVKSRPSSKCIEINKEIKDIMEILEIRTFQLKSYQFIPWGPIYSMKCSFSCASTCGLILRNSYRLKKYSTNNYNVRPDLSAEQRAIREKLVVHRKYIESSSKAKCSLKSWRYLVVAYPDGKYAYYEADYNSKPEKIHADLIPSSYRFDSSAKDQPTTTQHTQQVDMLSDSSPSPVLHSTTTRSGLLSKPYVNANSSFTSASL